MKSYIHHFVSLFVLSTLLLVPGCSGSGNPEAAKTTPPDTTALQAKPSAPPPPALVEAAPAPAAPAAKPRKTDARKPAAVKPPEPVPETPAPIAAAPTPVPPVPAAQPAPPPPAPVVPPIQVPQAVPQPTSRQVTIPAGTQIAVRMIDSVDSKTDHVGDTFRASIDSAVLVDNEIVLPKGGDAYLRLAQVSSAGDLRGKSEVQLELDRIVVAKKSYTVDSNIYESSGAAQGTKAARNVGIGAAIGAAIGAIAGGGKGAAIGAGVGAGSGVGVTVLTKGEQVRIPSETRLLFTLAKPVEITLPPASSPASSAERDFTSGPARLEPPSTVRDDAPRGVDYGRARRHRRP